MVHYELLGRDLEAILRGILSFLGLEVDERRLKVTTYTLVTNTRSNVSLIDTAQPQCTVDNSEGAFHRKKRTLENDDSIPKWDPYTNEQRQMLNLRQLL